MFGTAVLLLVLLTVGLLWLLLVAHYLGRRAGHLLPARYVPYW